MKPPVESSTAWTPTSHWKNSWPTSGCASKESKFCGPHAWEKQDSADYLANRPPVCVLRRRGDGMFYKLTKQVCYVCQRMRHRSNVCTTPDIKVCHACGTHQLAGNHSCMLRCAICGEAHLTGASECKQRLKINNSRRDSAPSPPGRGNNIATLPEATVQQSVPAEQTSPCSSGFAGSARTRNPPKAARGPDPDPDPDPGRRRHRIDHRHLRRSRSRRRQRRAGLSLLLPLLKITVLNANS